MSLHHDRAAAVEKCSPAQAASHFRSGPSARAALRTQHCTGAKLNVAECNARQLSLLLPGARVRLKNRHLGEIVGEFVELEDGCVVVRACIGTGHPGEDLEPEEYKFPRRDLVEVMP